MQRLKRATVIAAMAFALGSIVWTTPGSASPGVGAATVVQAQGSVSRATGIAMLPGTDVLTVQNSFVPGGSSGWHSHPGPAVITVVSGELTIHTLRGASCSVATYHAGDTFVEMPSASQNGVNDGSVDTVVEVVFFNVPRGGSPRVDGPDPGNC